VVWPPRRAPAPRPPPPPRRSTLRLPKRGAPDYKPPLLRGGPPGRRPLALAPPAPGSAAAAAEVPLGHPSVLDCSSPVWEVRYCPRRRAWLVSLHALEARDHRGRPVGGLNITVDAAWPLARPGQPRGGALDAIHTAAAPGGCALLRPAAGGARGGPRGQPRFAGPAAPLLVRATAARADGAASCEAYALLCLDGAQVGLLTTGALAGDCSLPHSLERPPRELNLLA
jgi:hypothetical protein